VSRLILRRLLGLVPLLLCASLAVFAMTYLAPGNLGRIIGGQDATAAQVAGINHRLGLDQPFLTQYFHWLGNAIHFDFGNSLITSQPVLSDIGSRAGVDLSLLAFAIFFSIIIGLPTGIIAAVRRGGIADRVVTFFSSLAVSMPTFWLGIFLVQELAVRIKLFPSGGYVTPAQSFGGWVAHMILPGLTLGLSAAGDLARQTRTSMVTSLDQDYIRTARAKGLSRWSLVMKHALRNSLLPAITIIGLQLPNLIGGTVTTETIFNLPGIGQLMLHSVLQRDIPVVQAIIICAVLVVVFGNLLIDVIYRLVDPNVAD
jgi:peptide/nickel transport system permease protein